MVLKEFKEISIQITLKRASNDNTSLPKHLNIIMKESWKGKKSGGRKQISTKQYSNPWPLDWSVGILTAALQPLPLVPQSRHSSSRRNVQDGKEKWGWN